jgi:uncharacterized protein
MLIEQIKKDQVEARKERDTVAATLLTTLLGEANMVAKNAQRETPSDEEVLAVVKKFLKSNAELQQALQKVADDNDRKARFLVAARERAVLNSYMRKQLSETEIAQIVSAAIAAGTSRDIGSLMAFLKTNHAGEYDGKTASAVVRAEAARKIA